MNFYIADTHFGHKNILLHDHRPFPDTEEMWTVMKELWNGRVDMKDDVWIIGDFCFWGSQENPIHYLRALKGKKHLIVGNHDSKLLKNEKAMSYFESVDYIKKIHDNGKTVILCHYPLAEWDGFFRGSIHIYGHIHAAKNDAYEFMSQYDNALNAGCMINGYTPASLAELFRNNESFKRRDGNMSLSDVEKYLSKTNVQEINARYKYREVICEICEHRFMWETNSVNGIYYLKAGEERGRQAICPKCGIKLAVFDSETVGLSESRNEIKIIREMIV